MCIVYFNINSYRTLLFYNARHVKDRFLCRRTLKFYLFSVSELFVDIPESGQADRIPVHIDISVLNIACQCKMNT